MKAILFLASILFTISACKKTEIDVEKVAVSSPFNTTVRFIENVNGKVILGGGNRKRNGFIAEYDEVVQAIRMISDTFTEPIYSCTYFLGRYVYVNESGTILYSANQRFFFEHVLNEKDFIPTLNQQPSRELHVNSAKSRVYNIAGGDYAYGLIQECSDTFNTWQPSTFKNELRSADFIAGTAWAGGFGILLKSTDDGHSWQRQDFKQVYITGIRFNNERQGLLTTFDEHFYHTSDGGENWKKSEVKGKKGYICAMEKMTDDVFIAVGNNGTVCISRDAGESWKCEKKYGDTDLHCVGKVADDKALIGGEAGIIWELQF